MATWYELKQFILTGEKNTLTNDDLKSVQDRIIPTNAFSNCAGLTSVTIPSSVKSIERQAFSNCADLSSVTINEGVKSIGIGAFAGCKSLTSVTINEGVESIGTGAFHGCTGLTSITIPSSVTSVQGYAFRDCDNLNLIVTENPLLLNISKQEKENLQIPQVCKIVKAAQFQEALSVFDDLELTNAQKGFLYVNKDRWQQLSLNELSENFGNVPLLLLEKLDHPHWNIIDNPGDIFAKSEAMRDSRGKAHELSQALAQSSTFPRNIGDLASYTRLDQVARKDDNPQKDTPRNAQR